MIQYTHLPKPILESIKKKLLVGCGMLNKKLGKEQKASTICRVKTRWLYQNRLHTRSDATATKTGKKISLTYSQDSCRGAAITTGPCGVRVGMAELSTTTATSTKRQE